MNMTGRTEFILGRKLYEREDGLFVDDRGVLHDWRNANLYVQRGPGRWCWIKPAAEQPRPMSMLGDYILSQAEGGRF